jgi:predicted anti-sigma-YlaC factor YlaD
MMPGKTDKVNLMKKECEWTKKTLPDYMRGQVFRTTRIRIDKHLQACVVCKSEFEALKSMEKTRQLLKDIDSTEGILHRVKTGFSALAQLKKILYRPLWLAGIALVVAGVSYYAMLPRQIDLEIDSIVKTAPATTTSIPASAPIADTASKPLAETASKPLAETASKPMTAAASKPPAEASVVPKPVVSVQPPVKQPVPARAVKPLAVSITLRDTSSLQQINEVMSGHEELRKMKFGDVERQQSGALTAKELLILFERMGNVAKVRYDRKRFKSYPLDQPIPFVLTLKTTSKTVEKTIYAPQPLKSAGTHTPAVTAAPAPLVTAPATSTAR